MSPVQQHHIAVLALDAVLAMEVGMPFQIFTAHGDVGYSLTLCSERPGPVPTTGGYPVVAILSRASRDQLARLRPGREVRLLIHSL